MTTTSTTTRPAFVSSPTAPEPATAEPAPPDHQTWSISTTGGLTITGHLPPWAEQDPSDTNIPLGRLSLALTDVVHTQPFDGQTTRVHHPAHADGNPGESEDILLNGNITCYPYSDDPAERTPFANVRIIDDFWINNLTPDDLTHLATQLRAQADRLDNQIRPTLTTARTDWAAHGTATSSTSG
ncbi:DUF6907 domain-containing protein [Streptomyces sp. NBC_01477]|uniref:DUF6907 domain-containing protein n=1 Tax=Streptomyces sp. NBC_01477 TaxID=2976015 RepID=UPI002E381D51|nr:hypothetical protein [Streptomyces sp. NBC_01477]